MEVLILDGDDGELPVPPSTTIVFLDESGDLKRNDPNNPIFAIGGIVVRDDKYIDEVRPNWQAMKARHFSHGTAIHFSALGKLSDTQIGVICDQFSGSFGRVALAVGRTFKNETRFDVHQILMKLVQQHIEQIYVSLGETDNLMFIIEESQGTRHLVQRDFAEIAWNSVGRTPNMMAIVMPKTSEEPGLELADAVCHAAAGQARESEAYSKRFSEAPEKMRKDFKVVFSDAPQELSHYTFITRSKTEVG